MEKAYEEALEFEEKLEEQLEAEREQEVEKLAAWLDRYRTSCLSGVSAHQSYIVTL